MFTLPKSFTDPTLHALTLLDYFDPRQNKLYTTDFKYLRGTELLFFYKALYTRENLTNNLDLFFPLDYHGHGLTSDDLQHILSKIEDEDLWQLAFITIGGLTSGNRTNWIKCSPYMLDYATSSRRVDCHLNRSNWTSQYSFRGDNFASEFTTILRELGTAFTGILNSYPSYLINLDPLVYNNATLSRMGQYASNRKVYIGSEYTAETLAQAMVDSPTMALRISASTHHHCKVHLTNPVTRENKQALFNTLSYSVDVLELLPWPLVVKGEKSPMLYGVELEVATNYTTRQLIEACDEPFMACKQDSSISGSMRNKVEIVTTPASMKSHKKEWSHFFSNLDYDNFDTTTDTNNGMHIHISRSAFTDQHLRTFAWFFGNPCNRDFIIALSERKANQMHQYAAMPPWSPNTSKTGSLKSVVQMFDMLRGAVNLHKSKPTVEVRIFKGIASYATILKNLEAVDAIFFFTQQCSQTSAGLREFLNFLQKTPRNKYPVLKEFITTLDTKKMISAAQLNDLVFNIQDPRQILSVIQKKNFPITSHHVTILNAKQGVRTFIFNKEHGTIEIVRTKHGKMSHLDRLLEKKYTRNRGTVLNPIPEVPIPEEPILQPSLSQMRNFEHARALHRAGDISRASSYYLDNLIPAQSIAWDIPTYPDQHQETSF